MISTEALYEEGPFNASPVGISIFGFTRNAKESLFRTGSPFASAPSRPPLIIIIGHGCLVPAGWLGQKGRATAQFDPSLCRGSSPLRLQPGHMGEGRPIQFWRRDLCVLTCRKHAQNMCDSTHRIARDLISWQREARQSDRRAASANRLQHRHQQWRQIRARASDCTHPVRRSD